jgi:plastocyanin
VVRYRNVAQSFHLVGILLAALGIAACSGASTSPSPTPPPGQTPPAPPATGANISIVRGAVSLTTTAFAPNPLTVAVGTTVTWVNNDVTVHDATADNHAFATGSINPGSSASVVLQSAGRISYSCTIHPGMTGTITVQ